VTATASPTIALTRVAGASRDLTAVAVSQATFPSGGRAKVVVLASDAAFPDALAGTPLAVQLGGPLLLTSPSGLPSSVAAEITRVLPPGGTVYVLGGTTAVLSSVDTQISAMGFVPHRLAGADRFATAVAIAGALGNPPTVFEATGLNFPDGLSAGAAAARVGGAVLLTDGPSQAAETAAYLAAHPGYHYAIGEPAAEADPHAIPIVGPDRFATSTLVAAHFFPSPTVAGFASGVAFPDALSGGAGIAAQNGPLVLVPPGGQLSLTTLDYLHSNPSIAKGYVYGGTVAVGADIASEITNEANLATPGASITDIDGTETLYAVSCPTTTWCAASDDNGNIIVYSNGTWSAPSQVFPPESHVGALSCPTTSFCIAGAGGSGYSTFNGSTWSAPARPSTGLGVYAVSCPTTTWCMAETDVSGDLSIWQSGSWSASGASYGFDVSSSPFSCVALGSPFCLYVNRDQYAVYSNGSWPASTTPIPGSTGQNSATASCTAPGAGGATKLLCVVVDDGGWAYSFTGQAWSGEGQIDAAAPEKSLEDISCGQTPVSAGTAQFCVAVDSNGNVLYRPAGAAWTPPTPMGIGDNYALSLSCPSSTLCIAVAGQGDAIAVQPPAGS